MPFVPRSQIEQKQANAPMSVVENERPLAPLADNANTEDQINELNELLAHVLDEISSLKSAIYEKIADDVDMKGKKSKKTHKVDADSDTSSEEADEKEAQSEKKAAAPQKKVGIDFSGCF
jgi:hypothetical protein